MNILKIILNPRNFKRLLLPALLVAVLALVSVPTAAAQGETAGTVTVIVPALNVRSGPGTSYNPVDFLLRDEQAIILAQDAASGWWQVRLPEGTTGWITNDPTYVSITNDELLVTNDGAAPVDFRSAAAAVSAAGIIVFQAGSGGAIYAADPDGSNLRYLTHGMDPALSPDGQTVAFTRWETSQDGALGNVWLINVDGSGERVVHEYVFNPRAPVWSADGSRLIISMQHGGRVQPQRTCGNLRPPREAYDVSVKQEDRKITGFCYTLPPDPHWSLRRIDLTTGQHQDLPGDTYALSPAWDPLYAGRVVFDGDFGLTGLDLYEGKTWAVTEDFNDHSPAFSPDGSQIAVSYRQDDHWEIHVLNADGSNRRRLTQTSYMALVEQQLRGEQPRSFNNASPAWSPDGSRIAFVTDRTGQWEIWVMNADGSNQQPLLSPEVVANLPLGYNGVDEQLITWR